MATDGSNQQNSNNIATYLDGEQNEQYLASAAQQIARRPLSHNQNSIQAQYDGAAGHGQWAGKEGRTPTGDWPVQYDNLNQQADVAKRDAQSKRKQIPPFIQKLSRCVASRLSLINDANSRSFLDESRNTDLIRWSDSGDSFIVLDEDEFAKTLIPELFKHNNYASFVRQLNMYGFHKKVGLSDNSMRASERKNKNPSEYSNPYFKRGRPNLLWLIHKPKNPPGKAPTKGRNKQDDFDEEIDETFGRDNSPLPINQDQLEGSTGFRQQPLLTMGNMVDRLPQNELTSLRQELREVQANQLAIREMLRQTRQEHQQLYGQAKAFHELHEKHDNSINAILSFLATVYNKNLAAGQGGSGEMFPNAIPPKEPSRGNVVDVGDENQRTQERYRKPQLLLEAGYASPTSPVKSKGTQKPAQQDSNSLSHDHQTPSPAVQELSDTNTASNRSSQSPQFRPTDVSATDNNTRQIPEADILRMMNNACGGGGAGHANGNNATMHLDFPEALNHLQTADGQSPLTPNQRQNMLQLMGNDLNAASPNSINSINTNHNNNDQALALANTPPNLNNSLANYDWATDALQLTQIERAMREHDERLNNLQQNLAPLSPSGSIPGISQPSPAQDISWAMNDDVFASGSDPGFFTAEDGANGGGLNFDNPYENLNIDGPDMDVPDFDFNLPSEGDVGNSIMGSTGAGTGAGEDLGQGGPKGRQGGGGEGGTFETMGSNNHNNNNSVATSSVGMLEQEGSPGKRRRRN